LQPKRPVRAQSVHELRQTVSARHKLLCASRPPEEARALLAEEYGADADSAAAFVRWLKDERDDRPGPPPAIERRHKVADLRSGVEREVETEPGSIPPRPSQPAPPAPPGRARAPGPRRA
jgi:hypothetical protein